jgi:dCMP deaminase
VTYTTLGQHIPDSPLRPSWDEWGLELAKATALRADCTRRKVGAVIMTPDHTIVSTGYNGAKPGGGSCLKGDCPRGRMSKEEVAPGSSYDTGPGSCIALHAEQNALLRCTWELMKGATMYITDKPCDGCMRMINGTPIVRIHYPD